jgi:methylated-DNA-[protein]-cysteine S-methyltransferase
MTTFFAPPRDEELRAAVLHTAIGDVTVVGAGDVLTHVFLPRPDGTAVSSDWPKDPSVLEPILREMAEYFQGTRTSFSIKLAPGGTPFQQQVWSALTQIPYGTTSTYGAIAIAIGRPRAARAVGSANNRNPLAIVVPCHRVIGGDGSLVGYAGGLDQKRALLELEQGH